MDLPKRLTRFNPKSANSGFTLVEIMIALTIIAVLSTIGLVIYSQTQKTARISKRVQDLQSIEKALQTYYAAKGSYPVVTPNTDTGWRSECSAWGGITSRDVIPGLVPEYLSVLPSDPQMNVSSNKSCYLYRSNGTSYKVLAHDVQEMTLQDYLGQKNYVDPTRDGGSDGCQIDGSGPWSLAVYTRETTTGNGACW